MDLFYAIFLSLLLPWCITGQILIPVKNPVVEGEDFMGNCSRPSGTSSIFVRVDGVPNLVNVTTQSLTFTTFTFPKVSRADNGSVLECFVPPSNVFATLTLEVLFAPNYTSGFSDVKVELGMPFSQNFTIEANPEVGDNFTWTRNGMVYSGNVTATSIFIPSTTVADAGKYTVTAGNTIGSTMASFTLSITCLPVFQNGSNTNIIVVEGENFLINCNITEECLLPTNITLSVSGETNPFVLTATRTKMFTATSSGTYTCLAENGQTANLIYMVQVLPRSSMPSSVTRTVTPQPTGMTTPTSGVSSSIGIIIGVVVGVSVLACVISILVPILICCCLGVGVFATVGCLAKNKKHTEQELKGLDL